MPKYDTHLVNSVSPSLNSPALLASLLSLLQGCELPEVVNSVEITDLHKPCSHALHDLTAGLETLAPMGLPLEKVPWVEGIRAKLEDAAKRAWWRGWPEGELLHQ